MKETTIRTLLKEFDYYKNTLEDTLEFILTMSVEIVRLKEEKENVEPNSVSR